MNNSFEGIAESLTIWNGKNPGKTIPIPRRPIEESVVARRSRRKASLRYINLIINLSNITYLVRECWKHNRSFPTKLRSSGRLLNTYLMPFLVDENRQFTGLRFLVALELFKLEYMYIPG